MAKIKVTEKKFLDWYFSDSEDKLFFANNSIQELLKHGKVVTTVQLLLDDGGYVPGFITENGDEDAEYSPEDVELINDRTSLSAAEVSILKEASEILCPDDDEDLIQMVRAIVNHEDENKTIDYIDGVTVWIGYEYSFTVEQFLEEVGYTGVEFKDSEIQVGEDQLDSFKTWLSTQVFVDPHMEYLIPIHFDSSLSYEENFSNLQNIYLK